MLKLMDEQLALIKLVTSRLEAEGFSYMLTGSIAMAVYTEPRMTRDVDIVIECGTGDAGTVARLFESDCYVDMQAVERAVSDRSMFNVIHRNWIAKVDFIIRKEDPYRTLEFERRRRLPIDDLSVWVVSPEDLILSKLAWARNGTSAQQQSDVTLLLDSVPRLDVGYLNQWAHTLGVHAALESLRKT